jgi:hypothetical protein
MTEKTPNSDPNPDSDSSLELFHLLQRSEALQSNIRRYEDELKTVNRRLRDFAFIGGEPDERVTADIKALNLRARITRRFNNYWNQDALWQMLNDDALSVPGVITDHLSVDLTAAGELPPDERDKVLSACRMVERDPNVIVFNDLEEEEKEELSNGGD